MPQVLWCTVGALGRKWEESLKFTSQEKKKSRTEIIEILDV